ncbi:MAG: methylmalonyl-CoA mutase family protein, partial [Acidimicrobiia bacterium]|nr:methylmalonyl-CoA mutase family protein [Acidimicrobiia bacterium]
ALPTEAAAELALRTQQIIAEETGVADTIDPLGGSWYVEEMTDRMERQVEDILQTVDRLGQGSMLDGVLRGIEENYFQSAIADSAYEFEKAVNSGERSVVGVNRFVKDEEVPIEILRIARTVEEEQRARVAEVRRVRDQGAVEEALAALESGARHDANLMPLLVEAARRRATAGEIAKRLKSVFGTYREAARF